MKVTKQGRLLNMLDKKEFFGEMAYIRGGALPRHATVESTVQLLLAEFEPAALDNMSTSAQLQWPEASLTGLSASQMTTLRQTLQQQGYSLQQDKGSWRLRLTEADR